MNIAVLIAGEYREFPVSHKTWSFLNWPNIDIYFSTWNKTLLIDKNPKIAPKLLDVQENDILNFVKPKSYQLLNYTDVKYTRNKSLWNAAMIILWKKSIELMEQSNIRYDRVILLRPDIALNYDEEMLRKYVAEMPNSDDTLHCINSMQLGVPKYFDDISQMPDLVYLGTQNAIAKLKDINIDPYDSLESPNLVDIHGLLAKECRKFYKQAYNIPIEDWCIVRSTSHLCFNKTFSEYKLDSKIWWESYHRGFFCNATNFNANLNIIERDYTKNNSLNLYDKYDLINPEERNKILYHTRYYPDQSKDKRDWHTTYTEDVEYNHNSYGFRIARTGPREFEEANGYPTMLVSGCSVTEGVGLHENHVWHSFLLQRLKHHFNKPIAKFNVGKGGRSGHSAIRNVYISIEHKNCNPDFVLLLLPPVIRQEFFYILPPNNDWALWHYMPNSPSQYITGDLQHLTKIYTTPNFYRKAYHELYKSLLFLKYYLQSKNIPWFFSFWQNDLGFLDNPVNERQFIIDFTYPCASDDIEYPKELNEHMLPISMPVYPQLPTSYQEAYRSVNVAKDYTHFGPASHHYVADTMYDMLIEKESLQQIFKKWE